jgi:hypothetical protein
VVNRDSASRNFPRNLCSDSWTKILIVRLCHDLIIDVVNTSFVSQLVIIPNLSDLRFHYARVKGL